MTESVSLLSLFTSSLLGATLLPGGSELVLFGVLNAYPETFWPALGVATLGNTLGGMISFGMGWLLPLRMGGSEAAGHPPASPLRGQTQQLKHVARVRDYGAPALLFAWLPLAGDALCLAAGWLRLNPWHAALFMAGGKFLRYWALAAAAS